MIQTFLFFICKHSKKLFIAFYSFMFPLLFMRVMKLIFIVICKTFYYSANSFKFKLRFSFCLPFVYFLSLYCHQLASKLLKIKGQKVEQMKRYGKEVIAHYNKELDGEEFEAFVIKGTTTYNIHVVSEKYCNDEANTLKFQEDFEDMANIENVHNNEDAKNYYSPSLLAGVIMEHFIWDRFYDEFGAAAISVKIEVE